MLLNSHDVSAYAADAHPLNTVFHTNNTRLEQLSAEAVDMTTVCVLDDNTVNVPTFVADCMPSLIGVTPTGKVDRSAPAISGVFADSE